MMWLFLFSIILISVNNVLSQCDLGWEHQFEGSCYHISRDPETWVDAMNFCNFEGGALAQIETDREQQFLGQILSDPNLNDAWEYSTYWIGGTDWSKEGLWIWEPSQRNVTYTNWAANEPNNHGKAGEDCMVIDRNEQYMWRDKDCTKEIFCLCEKPLVL